MITTLPKPKSARKITRAQMPAPVPVQNNEVDALLLALVAVLNRTCAH